MQKLAYDHGQVGEVLVHCSCYLCTHCLLTFVPSVSLQEVFYKLEVGMSSERPNAQTEGIYVQPPGSREWRNLTDVAKVVSYFIMLTFDLCCDYLAYL